MKILVGYVEDLKKSGIDRYLLGVLKIASANGIQLDFLTSRYSAEAEAYLNEKGCRLYSVHSLKKPFSHYSDVKRILSNGSYDRAYFNISEPLNMMGAKAAHDLGVECYVHSHSSGMNIASFSKRTVRGWINFLCRPFLVSYTDRALSCSSKAANWLFGRRVASSRCGIVLNAVDATRFHPNMKLRNEIRSSLGFSDKTFVFGHVGSHCYYKNNLFLCDILAEAVSLNPDSMMLLVGDGEDRAAVERRMEELGLTDHTRFLGIRSDVAELMQAMDVFVLPSLFEGLPIVAVEAQLSGLPCIVSDRVDPLVLLSSRSELLSLKSGKEWAHRAFELSRLPSESMSDKMKMFSEAENASKVLELVLE